MAAFLERFREEAYALLRIVSGFMFSFHGMQILFGVYREGYPADFHLVIGSQTWFGGMIELIGGLLILLGMRTRWAAFLCSGTMAVAYFQFHWKFQMDRHFFPALNQGELAALYSFVFLLIATRGSGKWSLDKKG